MRSRYHLCWANSASYHQNNGNKRKLTPLKRLNAAYTFGLLPPKARKRPSPFSLCKPPFQPVERYLFCGKRVTPLRQRRIKLAVYFISFESCCQEQNERFFDKYSLQFSFCAFAVSNMHVQRIKMAFLQTIAIEINDDKRRILWQGSANTHSTLSPSRA